MKNIFLIAMLAFPTISIGQLFSSYKKQLEAEEKKYKDNNPPLLNPIFPSGTLGEALQKIYELQGKSACQIIRSDKRLYIPREIFEAYGNNALLRKIYEIPISGENLLFLTLKPSDIVKLENGTIVEKEYISAKRIVGASLSGVNFGQASLAPIGGFPSLIYQKSCGSYFDGNLAAQLKIPIVEMSTSLDVETKKSSLVTTVTGKFFSPLYLALKQNTEQSIYMHLLLWEIYNEQFRNEGNKKELLIEDGKYISEMDATLIHRSNNSSESYEMQGKVSLGYSAGVFNINGDIKSGYENKVSFSLKDFHTYIHKFDNDKFSYELTNLPRYEEINSKLQNATNFDPQSTVTELVSHLVPIEITRVLTGIPTSLCEKDSWFIEDKGYDQSIWKSKPSASSTPQVIEGKFPKCVCKIKGYITKESIEKAVKETGTIDLRLELTNKTSINDKWLKVAIDEPLIKVTTGPRVLQINSDPINAARSKTEEGESIFYSYPINAIINSMGVTLTDPIKISGIEIEYVTAGQADQLLIAAEPIVNGNSVSIIIKTKNKPKTYIQEGESSLPIKLTFSVQLANKTTTRLITNTFNLKMPNLIEKPTTVSNVH